jgi:hypothetical protein
MSSHELVKEMNMARMEIPMFFMSMNIGLVDFSQPRQAFSGDKLEDITSSLGKVVAQVVCGVGLCL